MGDGSSDGWPHITLLTISETFQMHVSGRVVICLIFIACSAFHHKSSRSKYGYVSAVARSPSGHATSAEEVADASYIFNHATFCMKQQLPDEYLGWAPVRVGQAFTFTFPVYYDTWCATDALHQNLGSGITCNNECNVCAKPYTSNTGNSFDFNMSSIFNRRSLEVLDHGAGQNEIGGLTCSFSFDMDNDTAATATCIARNQLASFYDTWRWTLTVAGSASAADPLYVDLGAYLNIKFLAGEIVLSQSDVKMLSPFELVAGDYVVFTVDFYDAYSNKVGYHTTGRPSTSSWQWIYGFSGSPSRGLDSLSANGLISHSPTLDGKLTLTFQTSCAGNYTLSLGALDQFPDGAPVNFSVIAGPLSVSSSRVELQTSQIIAGNKMLLTVFLLDSHSNAVNATPQIVQDFTAGTKLRNYQLYESIPPISILTGQDNVSLVITFVPVIARFFRIRVGTSSIQVSNSPASFSVTPDAVYGPTSVGNITKKTFSADDPYIYMGITQLDAYSNFVGATSAWTCYLTKDDARIFPSYTLSPLDVSNINQLLSISTPTTQGLYHLYATTVDGLALDGCPFHITVLPGKVWMTQSAVSFDHQQGPFFPGALIYVKVRLVDAHSNVVTVSSYLKMLNFLWKAVIRQTDGMIVSTPILTVLNNSSDGFQRLSLLAPNVSNSMYKLHVGNSDVEFQYSPLDLLTTESPSFDVPSCTGQWGNNKITAGATAYLYVILADKFGNRLKLTYGRLHQVEKMINITVYPTRWPLLPVPSLYVHGYTALPSQLQYYGRAFVEFIPQAAGQYLLQVQESNRSIGGAPFVFTVVAGDISVTASRGFWFNNKNTFTPGDEAILKIQAMDTLGNVVSFATGVQKPSANFSALILETKPAAVPVTVYPPQDGSGYHTASFYPVYPGRNFHLQVGSGKYYITGSPFLFNVKGAVSTTSCTGVFSQNEATYVAGSVVYFILSQNDALGNPVPFSVDSQYYRKLSPSVYKIVGSFKLPLPTDDMEIKPLATSSTTSNNYTISFTIAVAGSLQLVIMDEDFLSVYGSPFSFACAPGPINSTRTIVQPGIYDIVAGAVTTFQVQFVDSYDNPTGDSDTIHLVVRTFAVKANSQTEVKGVDVSAVPASLGLFNVTYVLYTAGIYLLQVTASDSRHSPLLMGVQGEVARTYNRTVLAGTIYVPYCFASGDGLQGGVVGMPQQFSVSLYDSYKNPYPSGTLSVFFEPVTVSVNVSYYSGYATIQYSFQQIPITGSTMAMSVVSRIGSGTTNIPRSPFKIQLIPGPISVQSCTGLWLNQRNSFVAGMLGRLLVFQRDRYGNVVAGTSGYYNFLVWIATSNQLVNTSSTVKMTPYSVLEQGSQLITFTLTVPNQYIIQVGSSDKPFTPILGSPFVFSYTAGSLYLPFCIGHWLNYTSEIIAGDEGVFFVSPRDAWNNVIDNVATDMWVVMVAKRDSPKKYLDLARLNVQRQSDDIVISFLVENRGDYLLYVGDKTKQIQGSPFHFNVTTGIVDLSSSYVTGEGLSRLATVSLRNEIVVHLLDQFGNDVTEKEKLLSLAVSGPGNVVLISFTDLESGLYSASYSTSSTGTYKITVKYLGANLIGSPFSIHVVQSGGVRATYCRAFISPASANVQAGEATSVTIHAYDARGNVPSAVDFDFAVEVNPHPSNGSAYFTAHLQKAAAGSFLAILNVIDAGDYTLFVTLFGTRIGGGPYDLLVTPARWAVETSEASGSGLQNQTAAVGYALAVQLSDQYGNFITMTTEGTFPASLSVDVVGDAVVNYSSKLMPSGNGTYFGSIDWTHTGVYIVYVHLGKKQVKDSPFSITISPGSVFVPFCIGLGSGLRTAIAQRPQRIWVQLKDVFGNDPSDSIDEEGNSVAFYFLIGDNGQQPNDFKQLTSGLYSAIYVVFEVGQYQLSIKSSNGLHISSSPFVIDVTSNYLQDVPAGSVQCSYKNLSASTVLLLPYILSMPSSLKSVEDHPVPLQGGLPCMEVGYKDANVHLSVTLSALHGLLYFVPSMADLWIQVIAQSQASIRIANAQEAHDDQANRALRFSGSIPAIGAALQAIAYTGAKQYNGNDTISLHLFDPGGAGLALSGDEMTTVLQILAVNDPPYIIANPTIVASWLSGNVYGISVGDPDQFDVRTDMKVLLLQVCLTVSIGQISLKLISSKELNASTYQGNMWTTVPRAAVGSRIMVDSQGICFTASVEDCNTALGSSLIWYQQAGPKLIGNLKVTVNDLGNFGCFGDCSSSRVVPLQATAVIKLLPGRKPPIQGRTGFIVGSSVGSVGCFVVILVLIFMCRRHSRFCGYLEVYTTRRLEKWLGIDSSALRAPVDSQGYTPPWILTLPQCEDPLKFVYGEFIGEDSGVGLSQTALDQFWAEALAMSLPPPAEHELESLGSASEGSDHGDNNFVAVEEHVNSEGIPEAGTEPIVAIYKTSIVAMTP